MLPHNLFDQQITEEIKKRDRVFISHRQADKAIALIVAHYFEFIGLFYYLDEKDQVLIEMKSKGMSDDKALVESIDRGINHSTYILAILSERTMGSWWVPYEIGNARAKGCGIAHLLLPSIKPKMVPEYLRIYPQIWTAEELFAWGKKLSIWPGPVVHKSYLEWFEGAGPFAELGPSEEDVEYWYEQADKLNEDYLAKLNLSLKKHK